MKKNISLLRNKKLYNRILSSSNKILKDIGDYIKKNYRNESDEYFEILEESIDEIVDLELYYLELEMRDLKDKLNNNIENIISKIKSNPLIEYDKIKKKLDGFIENRMLRNEDENEEILKSFLLKKSAYKKSIILMDNIDEMNKVMVDFMDYIELKKLYILNELLDIEE